ncbi:MAG: carbohydrate ABC transporter substrate-binding protein [Kosmotoga sp.]|uniref:ABC transporter substrate-binding protein n=1 Tax=Kosmotoga sp. TaxID=1955248 RepID=UPI001E196150|nr:ABC transporter substrate-binding protein [Kosmotoga sp.]MBO8166626.1 carbohydrate ABC transporter substrate-binding protein [Kosmotoga sp.]
MKKVLVILVVLLLSYAAFASNQLEIFSWWTGGGEEEGLLALYDVFHKYYPDVEIINATVAGGAGTNAKAVLKTRMLGGNPPDSFQVHGGMELIDTYVVTGMMEPITGLLEQWGIKDKFPADILRICSYNGEIYSIPVNVHRGNVVFYNKAILEEVGIKELPATWPEFIEALKKIKAAGYVPLALGDKNKWTATHLFEDILLSTLGAYNYNGLWNGRTSFDHQGVKEALEFFKELMNYINENHASLTWQDATLLVFEGKAAFNVMGDWAEGYLKTLGWTPGKEFGWMTVPGTKGSFMVVTDTFGLPKNAPHRENAIKWLKIISSVEGQDTFNPIKGSIPARIDADKSLYDDYLTWSMNDFATNALCPSIIHGSAAPEGFATALNDTINMYITTKDVKKALREITYAAEDYLE